MQTSFISFSFSDCTTTFTEDQLPCTFSTREYFVGVNYLSFSCSFPPRGMQTFALVHYQRLVLFGVFFFVVVGFFAPSHSN